MNRKYILALMVAGACLGGCGGSSDNSPPVGSNPTPTPVPTATDFNGYVANVIQSGDQPKADPLPVDTITFTFVDDAENVFNPLIP